MREGFREKLYTLGDTAKKELAKKKDKSSEQIPEIDLKFDPDELPIPKETQKQIYDLQKKKQRIVALLQQQLENLNNPEYRPHPDKKKRIATQINNRLYWRNQDGTDIEVTLGGMTTDIEWGVDYFLDPETVPKSIAWKFLIEKARYQLQDLLDEQIVLAEVERKDVADDRKESYQKWLLDKKEKVERPGKIAEKMVKNFLRKIAFDFDVDFQVEPADVFQDVSQKADFIIRRKSRRRGVHVETKKETLGIQFTLKSNEKDLRQKQRSIDLAQRYQHDEKYFQDVILVSLPTIQAMDKYEAWQKAGRPSGGPDEMWSDTTKRTIFSHVMKGILTPEEIKENWQRIAPATTVDKRKAA